MKPSIAWGSQVSLRYRILLEDGSVAESNLEDPAPLHVRVGDGTFPEALEFCLLGLRPGQKDQRLFSPEQAWGPRHEERRQQLPVTRFGDNTTPVVGAIMEFALPDGEPVLGTVLRVDEHQVEVDFNHPLAGHRIRFEVEVIDATPSAAPDD